MRKVDINEIQYNKMNFNTKEPLPKIISKLINDKHLIQIFDKINNPILVGITIKWRCLMITQQSNPKL